MSGPSHLEAVPTDGPTFQQMAEATDASVFETLAALRSQYPGLGGAIVAGAAGGLARYQLQSLPDGSKGQQVLEVLAPVIRKVGDQIAAALRSAKGLPPPREVPVPPIRTAYDRLVDLLAAAPFPTFCISQGDHLLLVSTNVTPGGVLTHGSVVNVNGVLKEPLAVLNAHITMAARSWTMSEPVGLLQKVRARLAAMPSPGSHPDQNEGYALALRWVIDQFGEPDEIEGGSDEEA